jgi:hypothetical protein
MFYLTCEILYSFLIVRCFVHVKTTKNNNFLLKKNIYKKLYILTLCLVLWKESERKENYGNRWMNLD